MFFPSHPPVAAPAASPSASFSSSSSLLMSLQTAVNGSTLQPLTRATTFRTFHVLHALGSDMHFVARTKGITGTVLGELARKTKLAPQVAEPFLQYGPSMDVVTPSGYSSFLSAVCDRRLVAQRMLDYGADPRVCTGFNKHHALQLALFSNNDAIAERLLNELAIAKANLEAGHTSSTVWWCETLEELHAYLIVKGQRSALWRIAASNNLVACLTSLLELSKDHMASERTSFTLWIVAHRESLSGGVLSVLRQYGFDPDSLRPRRDGRCLMRRRPRCCSDCAPSTPPAALYSELAYRDRSWSQLYGGLSPRLLALF